MEPIDNTRATEVEPQLLVRFSPALQYAADMDLVSSIMEGYEKDPIAHAPWEAFPYKPVVRFCTIHSGDCLFLKFYVEESTVVAAHGVTHSPVYKDSCVEFFVSFDERGYYNFEFNSTGVCLAAFGQGREGRVYLPAEAVDRIRRRAVIDRVSDTGIVQWVLTLAFPLAAFAYHDLGSLHGLVGKVNFYKCGDDLPLPHFLSWAKVEAPEPDFHQPRYFGSLRFE